MTTHALMLIDMSGSMFNHADDVIGGFNSYLAQLRDDTANDYRLTVALFDHEYMSYCADMPPADVPLLTAEGYYPRGRTALNDAIGKMILEFEAKTGGGYKHEPDQKKLMVINTDGYENDSREFTTAGVRRLIDQRREAGWEFVFLGAGPDAWTEGDRYGMGANTVSVAGTSSGMHTRFTGAAGMTMSYASGVDFQKSYDVLRATVETDPNAPEPGTKP